MSSRYHQEQNSLVRQDNLRKFVEKIEENILPLREEVELIDSGDVLRFKIYAEKHNLSFKAERKLLQSKRINLLEIYFMYHNCHEDNEVLLVQILPVAEKYYLYHKPGKKAQMFIVKNKKEKAIRRFTKKFQFCKEVEKIFATDGNKYLFGIYSKLYELYLPTQLLLVEKKR
jgi:hypothetical protein